MIRALLLVEWIDAYANARSDGWVSQEDIASYAEPLLVRSVGWVMARENGMLVLAGTVLDDDGTHESAADGVIAIPEVMIQKETAWPS